MHKKIIFSEHAILKFGILKDHSVHFTKAQIEETIRHADAIIKAEKSRKIAQKAFTNERLIRVIFEEKPDSIIVITFYPARRLRYENKL